MSETTPSAAPTPSIDLLTRGIDILRAWETKTPTEVTWIKNGALYLTKMDARSLKRINCFRIGDKSDPAQWGIGYALIGGIGLRAYVDEYMTKSTEEKKTMSEALNQSVTKIQDELLAVSNALGMAKFEERKEITKFISQLSAAIQTGQMMLAPLDNKADLGISLRSAPSQDSSNIYLPIFKNIEFYASVLSNTHKNVDLDHHASLVLKQLKQECSQKIEDITFELNEHLELIHEARALCLKISFEGRQLFRLRPLSKHIAMFSEKIKDSLTRSALLQNQLSVLSLKKSSELGAKQLNTVKKALQFLVAVTTEFETFTRSLPKTVKEAEDYYSEHKLQTSKAKTKSIFADAKKRSSFNLGIDNRLALLLLLSLSVLALLHSDTLIKTLSFWRGQGLGAEMGVYKYSIDDNRWLGVVNTRKWESLRLQQKITMIDTLLGEIQSEEFDGFDLINDQGNQVATSIYEGEKLVWRLSQSSN